MKRIVSLGTFMDAGNIYVRKAYAAGITTGTSATEFSPNAALTSQQMATFIYRAFMYVRDNSEIRYTIYDSALGNYMDHWQIADWAKEPMAFMNALGLIIGTSVSPVRFSGFLPRPSSLLRICRDGA